MAGPAVEMSDSAGVFAGIDKALATDADNIVPFGANGCSNPESVAGEDGGILSPDRRCYLPKTGG